MSDSNNNLELPTAGLTVVGPMENLEYVLEQIKILNKDPIVAEKVEYCKSVVSKLDSHLKDTASPESAMQKKIWMDHINEPWDEHFADPQKFPCDGRTWPIFKMISGSHEGRFLQMIAELGKAKTILDIGMLTGYSAVTLAESSYCNEVITLEILPFFEKFVKSRIVGTKVENKIRIVLGPALESLTKLKDEGKKFDLIFIDADKPNYINYYKYIMDHDMLEKTGIILCDNVLWSSDSFMSPKTVNGKAFAQFVKFVQEDDRVTQVICPIRDGILMIMHKAE